MSDGNSTCPLDPMNKQNSNEHFQVHAIHWIQWTLSFGYLNGLVSTWCPYACHYVIQIHINWPTEKANVRWKFHLSIGSNGQTKFQWVFPGPLDPLDPMDTFVVSTWCPYACHYVIQTHVNWPTEKANVRWKSHLSIGSNGQTKFQWVFPGPLDPLDPLDTFVWLSQWLTIYMMYICMSLRHSNTN
jgi:hypothetical protein